MPPPVPQPTRRQMLLAGSALLGSGLLAACGQDGEDAASSSVPTSSAPTSAAPAGPPPAGEPVAWSDVARVPHLFFHSLVVDPARAFDGDDKAGGYLDFMVTVDEFDAVIRQVYERGYVLVSPHELYEVGEDDVVRPKTLMVPEGRTPLILSLDDCSYYLYMDGDGFADRLIAVSYTHLTLPTTPYV